MSPESVKNMREARKTFVIMKQHKSHVDVGSPIKLATRHCLSHSLEIRKELWKEVDECLKESEGVGFLTIPFYAHSFPFDILFALFDHTGA